MGYSLGVDLGTTFVAAALLRGSRAEMVTLGGRSVVIPSTVYLTGDGQLICGEAAVRQSVSNPERAARGFKRRLGDPTPLRIGAETRPVTELLAVQLREVLKVVTETEGAAPQQVMLTHPANWGPFRRGLFEEVPELAGLGATETVTEPEAAAAHYAASRDLASGEAVAVYDLGGGTFDVTVLRAHPDKVEILGVPEGIERLGGIDFDDALYAHIDHVSDLALSGLDSQDPRLTVALARIRQDCVLAKETLSVDTETVIPVFLPDRNFDVRVTRAQFEELIRAYIESTIGALERALRSAQLTPADLDAVLLVGGSSRIPLVSRMVTDAIGRPTVVDTHPKYAVALGAAALAGQTFTAQSSPPPAAQRPEKRLFATPPDRTDGRQNAEKPPALQLRADERRITVPSEQPFVIGRGDGVQLKLSNPRVSRHHGVLAVADGCWTFTDASRNGTFLDDKRIGQVRVDRPIALYLGGRTDGTKIQLIPETSAAAADNPRIVSRVTKQGRLTAVHGLAGGRLRIGRLSDNDVVLDDLLVSRRHAQLVRTGANWTLIDVGSGNGTFLNGQRITSPAPITAYDVIGIGRALLQLDGDRLVECVDAGDNAFAAWGITVITDKGTTLLHEVSFALSGKALLAVVGPSGAGKSTLLSALVGSRPAQGGEVRYAERSLYDDYDELRHRIALVPQDDVLHTQLTVADALGYAARLRFPADTTAADRERRVREVLDELGLAEHARKRVVQLSGGQRKRTSVALELLTKPSLLFLDEPTSGLDPGMDRSVMQSLRTLADDNRTVVVVTHNVANLEICDRLLLLAAGGWLAYFGPPAEALDYFGERDYADIFLRLEHSSGQQWAEKFRSSPQHARYVGAAEHHPQPPRASGATSRAPRQQGPLSQLAVLCRRYLAVIAADRQYLVFLAALPVVLSLLARAVPGSAGLSMTAATKDPSNPDQQAPQLLLVLIIGAALMGAAAAIRELVKERTIYQRERAVGLSISAYLTSKILVLTGITTLQITAFTLVSLLGVKAPDTPLLFSAGHLEVFVAVLAAGLVTLLISLAISALIGNADQGMPVLVLMVMAQLVFSGGLFAVHDRPVLEQLAWLAPSRWAYAMAAATSELSKLDPPKETPDPLWEHTASTWAFEVLILGGMAAILITLIAYRLLRLDPKRRT